MKWKNVVLSLAVMTCLSQSVFSADFRERFVYERSGDRFGANELQLDLFGTYADRNMGPDRTAAKEDRWGGGLGINYFPSKYLGLGVDSYLEEWRWPYRVNGSLILRMPIEQLAMAPYIFGGGGREFKYLPQWTAHAGAGLEFRLNRWTGLFADGRRVFSVSHRHGDDLDYWLARFGLRFNF